MELDSYNCGLERIENVNHVSVGRQPEDQLRRKMKANQVEVKQKPLLKVSHYTFSNDIDQIKNKIMKMMVCTEERKAKEQSLKALDDFSLMPV
jgi:hypothetical protein